MIDVPQIKQRPDGLWFLEGEQLWDSDILPVCLEHIKEGDTVIDAGAWIGGHTMAYAKKVGTRGMVHAFEPNRFAFGCLKRNTEQFEAYVTCDQVALGDSLSQVWLSAKRGWYDSGHIGLHDSIDEVMMSPLDDYSIAPNFIKIDVEGCELKALKGAEKTIEKHRPIMVVEVNKPALERQGSSPLELFKWLGSNRYIWKTIEQDLKPTDVIFNILATPE